MKTQAQKFYFDLQKCISIAREITLPSEKEVMLKYIEENYKGGEIIPINVPRSAVDANTIIRKLEYNYDERKENTTCQSDDEYLVAVGHLNEDVEWCNSDAFETAGGYRLGAAKRGAAVKVYVKYTYVGFSIRYVSEVNITKSHYNNNFYGSSTGNGTKTYEEGEVVETQEIAFETGSKSDYFDFMSKSMKLQKIDTEKIKNFVLTRDRSNRQEV